MMEVSTSASYVKNPEISNDKVYFIAVVSNVSQLLQMLLQKLNQLLEMNTTL